MSLLISNLPQPHRLRRQHLRGLFHSLLDNVELLKINLALVEKFSDLPCIFQQRSLSLLDGTFEKLRSFKVDFALVEHNAEVKRSIPGEPL